MLGIALLVFREVLEAALIVTIVAAATRGVPRRGWYIASGIGLGILGAMLVALFAGVIEQSLNGAGQAVFDAGVLLAAVTMIGWHVVWMSNHARELVREMQAVGHAVQAGSSSLAMLLVVVALAVLREGSEIVLFLYGMVVGGAGRAGLLVGVPLGMAAGTAMGFALYRGLLRIPLRHFFTATNAMLVLLASGLAETAAGFLQQADWLPSWGGPLWNTSTLLSDGSLIGQALHILIGYEARPSGIQVATYLVTLLAMIAGMRWARRVTVGGPASSPAT